MPGDEDAYQVTEPILIPEVKRYDIRFSDYAALRTNFWQSRRSDRKVREKLQYFFLLL